MKENLAENISTKETNDYFVVTGSNDTHYVKVFRTEDGYTHTETKVTEADESLNQMRELSIAHASKSKSSDDETAAAINNMNRINLMNLMFR